MTLNLSNSTLCPTSLINKYYIHDDIVKLINMTIQFMTSKHESGTTFPYFPDTEFNKPVELDIYITEPVEAQELNNDSRGKNYATNILSYPSDMGSLPKEVLNTMPTIILGELVICHDVVVVQANEQGKSTANHLTHLLVHGILHLLGFDHELSEDDRLEMEAFEIEILQALKVDDPYL